jgi:hypothetical protein
MRFVVDVNEDGITVSKPAPGAMVWRLGRGETLTLSIPGRHDDDELRMSLVDAGFIPEPQSQKRIVVDETRIRLKVGYPVSIVDNVVIPAGREGTIVRWEPSQRDGELMQVKMDNYGGEPIWLDRKAVEIL